MKNSLHTFTLLLAVFTCFCSPVQIEWITCRSCGDLVSISANPTGGSVDSCTPTHWPAERGGNLFAEVLTALWATAFKAMNNE